MAANEPTRRLTAILAADVVGYSRLMAADETGTLERLKRLRRETVQPRISEFSGRIVKLMGDGLLAEFPSVVDAVSCAVAIQDEVEQQAAASQAEDRIRLRVGINLGDVIIEGHDIYGDGVNVAARLESIADAGTICLSAAVRTSVGNRLPVTYEDLGERELKNISVPVHVFQISPGNRVAPDQVGETPGETARRALPDKPSIAVLPFNNMSGEEEQGYFCDGLTEDIITELSHHRDLFVTARNSSFVYRDQSIDIVQVGKDLNVRFVLEGSIRKAGQRIRINAQLIDSTTGGHIWAERYDRDIEDVFAVQDELVRTIAAALNLQVEIESQQLAKRKPPSSLKAYDVMVQGLHFFYRWTPQDNRLALGLFEQATGLDPEYAPACAWLAEAHFREGLNGWSVSLESSFRAFFDNASRAVSLDENDSRTQATLGVAELFRGQHDLARYHLEKALALNPSDTRAMVHLARCESLSGHPEQAVAYLQEASRYNPLANYNWYAGQVYYIARRYTEAIEALAKLSHPNALVHAFMAASYAQLGNGGEASRIASLFTAEAEKLPERTADAGTGSLQDFVRARFPFRSPEDAEHLREGLVLAGISQVGTNGRGEGQ